MNRVLIAGRWVNYRCGVFFHEGEDLFYLILYDSYGYIADRVQFIDPFISIDLNIRFS